MLTGSNCSNEIQAPNHEETAEICDFFFSLLKHPLIIDLPLYAEFSNNFPSAP
jgi:hypothetical protein